MQDFLSWTLTYSFLTLEFLKIAYDVLIRSLNSDCNTMEVSK